MGLDKGDHTDPVQQFNLYAYGRTLHKTRHARHRAARCADPVAGADSEPWNATAPIAINIGNATSRRPDPMIRKLQSGEYRLYSRKVNPKTGKRRNLGTFKSRAAAEKHERDVQYFKRH